MTKERIFIAALALALLLSLSSCVTYPDVVPGTTSPVTSEPETTEDITFEPTTTEPETIEPQTSEPETTEPLSTEPETTEMQTTEPETTAPKTSEPETTAPQTTVPETTKAPKVYPAVSASDAKEGYLTYSGINEVSSGKNIIIFLVDRFDVTYYSDLVKYDSNFFSPLTGFTYFKDNVSLYSRTFPGICSMITGIDNDFSRKRADYFEYAYQNSPFLNDLRINNYTVKLYIDPYYTYETGSAFVNLADNFNLYRPGKKYELNDSEVFKFLGGQTLTVDDSANSFIFIHLSGGHSPYHMDENGNYVKEGSSTSHLRGDFSMIYSYLDELRRLGLYEDSTIIITGDHPRARDDTAIPTQTRLTALFVKTAGRSEEPLEISSRPVSQQNLLATIVQSASIETSNNYGETYFEAFENETPVRYHKFELYDTEKEATYLVVMKITGKGTDFSHWEVSEKIRIGSLYK